MTDDYLKDYENHQFDEDKWRITETGDRWELEEDEHRDA
jgi:hypothetical protein